MSPAVPLAFAISVFLYYNWMGLREQGVGKYLLHFAGPVWWMAPVMIPIEIISHFARPLSLTIRLYANMFAGERVTITFLSLTYLLLPAVFMGSAHLCGTFTGFHIHAAGHYLRRRRSGARALTALSVRKREPAVPQGGLGTTSSRTILYKEKHSNET